MKRASFPGTLLHGARALLACACLLGADAALPAAANAGDTTVPAAAPERGKAVFDLWCSGCHKPLGPYTSSVAGTNVLARKYGDRLPAALEERTDLTAATVKFYVRTGVKFMPFFRKTEISDADLQALSAYLTRKR